MISAALKKFHHRFQTMPLGFKAAVSFILGAGCTLTMPPWSMWPLLWVCLPGLLSLVGSTKTKKAAGLVGWTFGLGFFATGFTWITNAFFVDRETFAALAVPAVGGLAAGFALYISVVAVAVAVFPAASPEALPRGRMLHAAYRAAFFAAVWALVEWWRCWFLTGFPWNPIGSVWVAVLPVLQGASVVGVYGLSFLTVLAAASVMMLVRSPDRRLSTVVVAVCHLPLVLSGIWGAALMSRPVPGPVPGVMLRLVQPNIAQADKWRPGLRDRHLVDQVRMSVDGADAVTHVLWAETAAPFSLNRAPQALATVATAVPDNGVLLTGAPRIIGDGADRQAFNSLYAVSNSGEIVATYDKTHLVPFGEYTPLRWLIPLPQLTGGTGFAAGPGPQTLTVSGLPPFSPLICYEIIFAGAVTQPERRPNWLFNLTNDAWFGMSSGPYQHLAAAQLRAVEEGLPVVRVANTGISAVIDSHGRTITSLGLEQRGFIDSVLPQAPPPTVFARTGNALFLVITLLIAGLMWGVARRTDD